MKKYFGIVLAFMLIMGSTVVASAQKANPASDFEYDLNSEGTGVVIKGYKGKVADVIIPSIIEDFPVVELGYKAFQESKIVSVIIPDNVTLINSFAFSGCTSLNLKEKAKIKKAGYRGSFD